MTTSFSVRMKRKMRKSAKTGKLCLALGSRGRVMGLYWAGPGPGGEDSRQRLVAMISCWFLLMIFYTFMGPFKDKGHTDLVFVFSVDHTVESMGIFQGK